MKKKNILDNEYYRKKIPIFIIGVLIFFMFIMFYSNFSYSQEMNSTERTLMITRPNCPIYQEPNRANQIHTEQPGNYFKILEVRKTDFPEPFYQIQYGNQNAVGWVYGEHVKVIRAENNLVKSKGTGENDIKTSCLKIYRGIKRLIEIYNDESAQLTSKYNLRPFPAFSIVIDEQNILTISPAVDGTLTIPLNFESEERRLSLPQADKFLFYLVISECFKTFLQAERVLLKIHFENDNTSLHLECSRLNWMDYSDSGLMGFWNGIICSEKGKIWKAG